MNNSHVLIRSVVVLLLAVFCVLGGRVYAYTATSLPSFITDGGNIQINDPFAYSMPDINHTVAQEYGILHSHNDYVQPGSFPSFYKNQTSTYSLKTGVYTVNVYQKADYLAPVQGSTVQQVDFHPVSRVVTVINKLSTAEYGHVQLVSKPSIIDCNTNFDLAWPSVQTDSGLGSVEYEIQERRALIHQSFTSSWVDAAGSLAQTSNGSGYEYTLNGGKPGGYKYQYRIKMRGLINGHAGAWTTEPVMSDVIAKPMCTPATDQSKYSLSALSVASDEFNVVAPNSHGISFTKIPALNVTAKPLHILNFDNADTGKPAAKIIVIEADSFVLSNHINILGKQAELVLLNTNTASDSQFSCVNCSFENSPRITLAMAKAKFGLFETSSELNQLLISKGSTLKINGILAPGAASLDLLAEDIDMAGIVTTNYRASLNDAGEYQIDPAGSAIIGAGSVNIFAGNLGVHYEEQKVRVSKPRNPSSQTDVQAVDITGNIESAAVNISSHEPLIIKAQISTHSDALASDVFKGQMLLPNGLIKIQTFGRSSVIDVRSSLVTDQKITLHSRDKLNIKNIIDAPVIDIVSGDKTHLQYGALLDGQTLRIGAGSFENNGSIKGQNVSIETDQNLLNRFGGAIRGINTRLSSVSGVVRNGSLTPYRVTNGEASNNDNAYHKSYKDGTYYSVSAHEGSALKVNKLSAHVYGDNISIKARRFENINPYFRVNKEGEDWSDKVSFQSRFVNQVSVQAVKSATISVTEKLVNSSALIYILGKNSSLKMHAVGENALISNERYRTEILLNELPTVHKYSSRYYHFYQDLEIQDHKQTEVLTTVPFVYSPPGYIYVAGDSEIKTSSGLVNDLSFIELIGKLKVQGPITSKGIRVTQSTYTHSQEHCIGTGPGLINLGGGASFDPCEVGGSELSSSTGINVIDVGTRATLFRVFGDIERFGTNESNEDILRADFAVKNTDGFSNIMGDLKGVPLSQRDSQELRDASRSDLNNLKEYVKDIKEAVLNAWDTVKDWFS